MTAFILRYWKILGTGLVVLVLIGCLAWQGNKITSLKRERDDVRASLASYRETLEAVQANTAAKIAALEGEKHREVSRARDLERLIGQIEGASNEKDGPVASVLRAAFDSLYGPDAAGEVH